MAGARYLVEVNLDDRDTRAALDKLQKKLSNLQPLFEEIGGELLISLRDRFGRGVDSEGQPWAPLSPVTIAHKRKNKNKILVLDGLLRRLSYQADANGLRLGTDRVYGAMQLFGARQGEFGRTRRGAPIPWGNVPAREYIGLSETDQGDILDIIDEWLAA